MKLSIFTLLVALATLIGCARQGGTKVDADPPEDKGIEVTAPGVDVQVKPGEGVDVKAPGVDVKTSPTDGPEVNVEAAAPE